MNRLFVISAAAALVCSAVANAQSPAPAANEPQKPKAGSIIERPNAGGIVSDTPASKPTTPSTVSANTPLAGRKVERFEATGNVSVASDTIRVYLGVAPGEPYNPDALQRNFLNLWQTGLFDDIRLEADAGDNGGVVVRAIVKERPRIGSVEYRGNKELQTNKITEQLEKDKIDIHVGNTIEQTLVKRAAESIKKAYTENG